MQPTSFQSKLQQDTDGTWWYVHVSKQIRDTLKQFEKRGIIHVRVTIGQTSWDGSVLPWADGSAQISVNKQVRSKENLQLHDLLGVTIAPRLPLLFAILEADIIRRPVAPMSQKSVNIDYQQFFMNVPNPHLILRADDDLTIVGQNDAHVNIALVEKGAVIGKPLLKAFPDTSQKFKDTGVSDLAESFRTVIRTGKPDAMPAIRYDLINDQGEQVERWWRATHYPLFDTEGNVVFMYQLTEDITASKEVEASLARNERLSALNKAKDEFVALASHQLRSPASIVKQYIGFLTSGMAGTLQAEQLQFLQVAAKANNRLLKLLDDLLKTVQLDAEDFKLQLVPQDIVALVRSIAAEHEPLIEAKHQQLIVTSSKQTLTVALDALEFSICIANLIENASKYSGPNTTIEINIRASKTHACVEVTDHGVGMAKADQAGIFDKFVRVNNELSDTVSGSGLGLYWVQGIVRAHGGDIKVDSKPGKGTTFTVRLPL